MYSNWSKLVIIFHRSSLDLDLDLWKIVHSFRNEFFTCLFKIQNVQVIQNDVIKCCKMMSSNVAKWCHHIATSQQCGEIVFHVVIFNVGNVRNVVDVEDESTERGSVRGWRRRAGSVPWLHRHHLAPPPGRPAPICAVTWPPGGATTRHLTQPYLPLTPYGKSIQYNLYCKAIFFVKKKVTRRQSAKKNFHLSGHKLDRKFMTFWSICNRGTVKGITPTCFPLHNALVQLTVDLN